MQQVKQSDDTFLIKNNKSPFSLMVMLILVLLCEQSIEGQYCNMTQMGTSQCYPCYYRCGQCNGTSENNCSVCLQQYILFNEQCLACGQNCQSCKNTPLQSLTQQNIQIQCESCNQGYYLSQSLGMCIKCPTGASTCTLSAIQQCQDRYYEQNGICSKCISNCLQCNNAISCQKCIDQYYFNSLTNKCQKCLVLNCQTCNINPSICQKCLNGFNGNKCTQTCQINCAQCYSDTCYLCKVNYYLNPTGKCKPLRLLCQQSDSFDYCVTCMTQYATLSSTGYCVPYYTVHDYNRLTYMTAINDVQQFYSMNVNDNNDNNVNNNNKQKQITVVYCEILKIYFISVTNNKLVVQKQIQPSYKIKVMFQLKVETLSQIIYIKSNGNINYNNAIQLNLSSYVNNQIICSSQLSYIINSYIQFKTSQQFNSSSQQLLLQFSSSLLQSEQPINQNRDISISELTIQQYRCLVRNCLICYSSYTCKACRYPYQLQNNQCVDECAEGYYFTQSINNQMKNSFTSIINSNMTNSLSTNTNYLLLCTLQCLQGYYPQREQYQCLPCISPCIQCSDQYTCLKCNNNTISNNNTINNQLNNNNNININQQQQQYSLYEYYLYQSQCLSSCPSYYFPSNQLLICQQCIFPCYNCSSSSKCTTCKVGYLNNLILKCVMQCPSGLYSDVITLVCEKCKQPCKTCTYMESSCTSCVNDYVLDEGENTCVQYCNDGYTQISININNQVNKYCKKCKYPCKTCQKIQQNCTSCYKGYLYNNTCLNQCPQLYYQLASSQDNNNNNTNNNTNNDTNINNNTNNTINTTNNITSICSLCISPCLSCINEQLCQSCIQQFKLYKQQKQCVSQCPSGSFFTTQSYNNIQIQICQKCIPPCNQCMNQTYCLSCTGLLFLNHKGQCLIQCPRGTYIQYDTNTQQRVCLQCPSECILCTSSTTCLSCVSQYYYYQNYCYSTCPNTTFSNINGLKICQSCQYPCKQCINQFQCKSCVNSFWFQVGTYKCVQYCQEGYLQNNLQMLCEKCSKQCKTCQNQINNCTKCAEGYYMDMSNKVCRQQCPQGTYKSNLQNICVDCFWPCKTCTSDQTCLSCYMSNNTSNESNESNTTNTSISQQYYILFLSDCINECPNKYYMTSIMSKNLLIFTCLLCDIPCEQCSYSSTNCTKCKSPFISYNKQILNNSYKLQCVEKCPNGYYENMEICQICILPCKVCVNENYCTECAHNYYLLNGQCVTQCITGYYSHNITLNTSMITSNISIIRQIIICSLCSSQCYQCQSSSMICTSCNNNYYILYDNNNKFISCVSTCPIYFYPSSKQLKCKQCISPCQQCYNLQYCKSCLNGYILENMKCILQCSQINYLDINNNSCLKCVDPCFTCKDKDICTSCDKGYYFLQNNSSCVSTCPSLMYKQQIKMSANLAMLTAQVYEMGYCFPCSNICLQCTSYTTCISCNMSSQLKYLQNSKCQKKCTQGYYQVIYSITSQYKYQCLQCTQNCLICSSSSTCQKCISSFLHNNKCISQCPSKYYQSSSFTCEKCVSPCMQCYNQVNCITCVDNYFLFNNICVKTCPQKMWTDLQTRKCVQKCNNTRFINVQNKTCMTKCDRFYSSDKKCLLDCQSLGYNDQTKWFINMTLGCQKCTQSISSCIQTKQNLKYDLKYIIQNGKLYLLMTFSSLMSSTNHVNNLMKNFIITAVEKSTVEGETRIDLLQQLDSTSDTDYTAQTVTSKYLLLSNSIYDDSNSINKQQQQYSIQKVTSSQSILTQNEVKVIKLLSNSLWLQVVLPISQSQSQQSQQLQQSQKTFSGHITLQICNILFIQSTSQYHLSPQSSQQLPLQQILSSFYISYYNASHSLPQQFITFISIIGQIICYVIVLLIIINLIIDNLKCMFYLIDFTQGLFLIIFIGGNNTWIGIYDFLKSFKFIAWLIDQISTTSQLSIKDKINQIQQLQPSILMNTNSKYIKYANYGVFQQYYLPLAITIVIFIIIIGVMKLITKSKEQISAKYKINHHILYNHINNFYWLFIDAIWLISTFNYYSNSQTSSIYIIDISLIIICLIITLILSFQILKNVFNSSFQQKSFFWGLKRHKVNNQQANIHLLLLIIRKTILLISVTFSTNQFLFYFLLILISIVILSNILANQPFRKRIYQLLFIIAQLCIVLFYFGILLYIVNVKRFDQLTYQIVNYVLFSLSLLIVSIFLFIAVRETIVVFRKIYERFKDTQGNQQSSQTSKNTNSVNSIQQKNKLKIKNQQQNQVKRSQAGSQKSVATYLPVSLRKLSKKIIGDINQKKLKTSFDVMNRSKPIDSDEDSQYKKKQITQMSGFDLQFDQVNQSEFGQPAKYLVKLQKQLDNDQPSQLNQPIQKQVKQNNRQSIDFQQITKNQQNQDDSNNIFTKTVFEKQSKQSEKDYSQL